MQATRASVLGGIQKEKPVKRRERAIKGKVVRRRLRRPKVSIVWMAGRAKTKFMMPKPREAVREERGVKPEREKMAVE
jgi:hypothetical protein